MVDVKRADSAADATRESVRGQQCYLFIYYRDFYSLLRFRVAFES